MDLFTSVKSSLVKISHFSPWLYFIFSIMSCHTIYIDFALSTSRGFLLCTFFLLFECFQSKWSNLTKINQRITGFTPLTIIQKNVIEFCTQFLSPCMCSMYIGNKRIVGKVEKLVKTFVNKRRTYKSLVLLENI